MKKLIISSVLLMILGCHINIKAQNNDSFFDYGPISSEGKEYKYSNIVKSGVNTDSNRAPLSSGLLILGGLALGYASLKKNKD